MKTRLINSFADAAAISIASRKFASTSRPTLTPLPPLSARTAPHSRGMHLVVQDHPKREPQLQFSLEEQAVFGFPKAIGYGPGEVYLDKDGVPMNRGRFAAVEPMKGNRQHICELKRTEQVSRVNAAINEASAQTYDPENVDGLSPVAAVSHAIEAALNVKPIVPSGEYVSGPELAKEVRVVLKKLDDAASLAAPPRLPSFPYR